MMAKRSCRLVHDDDFRLIRKRLGDLDHLLLPNAQFTHARGRIEIELDHLKHLFRLTVHARSVEQTNAIERLPGEKKIFRDAQVFDDRQLLINNADPKRACVVAIAQRDLITLDKDAAPWIGGIDTRQYLHQRALARPVLPGERKHLPLPDLKVDAVERLDAGERLGDVSHLQKWRFHHFPLASCPGYLV